MKLNIKDKLNEKNMTRYELAKRIGVTYPTITAIYNGENTAIKLDILEAICRELECTPDDIIVPKDPQLNLRIEYNEVKDELLVHLLNYYIANSNPNSEESKKILIEQASNNELGKILLKYMQLNQALESTPPKDETE